MQNGERTYRRLEDRQGVVVLSTGSGNHLGRLINCKPDLGEELLLVGEKQETETLATIHIHGWGIDVADLIAE